MAVELDPASFRLLSSETRVRILRKLSEKPRNLSALAQELGMRVQSVDEQLRKLQSAGLVSKTRHAKWTYYQLTAQGRQLVQPQVMRQPVYLVLGVVLLMAVAGAGLYYFNGSFNSAGKTTQNNPFVRGAHPSSEAINVFNNRMPAGSGATVAAGAIPDQKVASGTQPLTESKAVASSASPAEANLTTPCTANNTVNSFNGSLEIGDWVCLPEARVVLKDLGAGSSSNDNPPALFDVGPASGTTWGRVFLQAADPNRSTPSEYGDTYRGQNVTIHLIRVFAGLGQAAYANVTIQAR